MKDQSDQYVLDTSYIERPEGSELADFHTHSTASDGTLPDLPISEPPATACPISPGAPMRS